MKNVLLPIWHFFKSDLFNKWISIGTMLSKYIIAIVVVWLLRAWYYLPTLIIVVLATTALGIVLRVVTGKHYKYIKYAVIAVEFALFAYLLTPRVFLHTMFQPLSLLLTLPLFGNFAGELVRSYQEKHPNREVKHHNVFIRVFDTVILSEQIFGVERLAKFALGAYFSFVFGLQAIANEAVVLGSFGVIGSAEVEIEKYKNHAKNVLYCCQHPKIVLVVVSTTTKTIWQTITYMRESK